MVVHFVVIEAIIKYGFPKIQHSDCSDDATERRLIRDVPASATEHAAFERPATGALLQSTAPAISGLLAVPP